MTTLGVHNNSPLRYPGGKSRRATRLLKFADTDKSHYVEPFAGGLGVFFRARRDRLFKTYHVNDVDDRVVNFWLTLRDESDALLERLWKTYQTYGAGDESIFRQYQNSLDVEDPVERAAAYYWVCKCALRGVDNSGMLKSTKSRKGISPGMLQRLPLYSDLLQGVEITQSDFQELPTCADTFLYLDPPYETVGESFYRSTVDLMGFRDWLVSLPASWLVTLNDSESTTELFARFDVLVEPVRYPSLINPRFLGGNSISHLCTEIVVMNYQRHTRDLFARRFRWELRCASHAA